ATKLFVPRPLHVQQREPAFLIYSEAGDRIVVGVGSEQKATIRRENDTARTLVVVRPLDVVDGAQIPRTGAARGHTFHLGQLAVRAPWIVGGGVLGLFRLEVEGPATSGRFAYRRRRGLGLCGGGWYLRPSQHVGQSGGHRHHRDPRGYARSLQSKHGATSS